MNISNALAIIKRGLKKDFVEAVHFKDQCSERNLDLDEIRELIKKNKILGIIEQNENLYKVWFFYKTGKDLNMILRILPGKRLRLITLFPCKIERRIR